MEEEGTLSTYPWVSFGLVVLGAISVSFWYSTRLRTLVMPNGMDLRTFCWIVSLIQWGCAILAGVIFYDGYVGLVRYLSLMLFFEYGVIWHVNKNTAVNLYPIPVKRELTGRKAQLISWLLGFTGLFVYLVLLYTV
jgi:hypothetical protein